MQNRYCTYIICIIIFLSCTCTPPPPPHIYIEKELNICFLYRWRREVIGRGSHLALDLSNHAVRDDIFLWEEVCPPPAYPCIKIIPPLPFPLFTWILRCETYILSSEMELADIKFIQKAFFKERGAEVFRKIWPTPILWEPLKDSALPCTAVGNSETNSQWGNEINRAVGIDGTCVGFFKGWTEFPHSLWRASNVFALVPTSLQVWSRNCQHLGAFIALLPILRSVHSTVAYREKQHSNCKNFSAPLSTRYRFQFVHSTVVNSCMY